MKKLLILILTILLFIPLVQASIFTPISSQGTQYLTRGVTNPSSFLQGSSSDWENTTAVRTQLSGTYKGTPVVADVDADGINEIVILNGATLEIRNFTSGVGFVLESSVGVGTQSYGSGNDYYQTVGLIDPDADNLTNMILMNQTHFLNYEWNTTSLNLINSTTHGLLTRVGSMNIARYPVVKCEEGNNWADSDDRCIVMAMHWNGIVELAFVQYNLDLNLANFSNITMLSTNADNRPANTHLVDADNDGFVEGYYAYFDDPNDDLIIYEVEVSATGIPTTSLVKQITAGQDYTDIIVADIDGTSSNGKEITAGYTPDGTNWDGYTIDTDGNVIEDDYCGVTECPEGEKASMTLVSTNTVGNFCSEPSGIYYYVRNANNNDPATDTDTILCLQRYTTPTITETTVANTQNFSTNFGIHEARLYGSQQAIITSLFGATNSGKETNPQIISESFVIPVDYQLSGSLDLIGVNGTLMVYYDDGYVNQQLYIYDKLVNPKNPVCQNTALTYRITVSDVENDGGNCTFREEYVNGTVIATIHTESFVSTSAQLTANYNPDTVGTFNLVAYCSDEFHQSTAVSHTHTVTVSNDTVTCNNYGDATTSETFGSPATTTADAENTAFDSDLDGFFDGIRMSSPKARLLFALFVIGALAVAGYRLSRSEMIAIASGYLGAIALLSIGFLSLLPFTLMTILCIAFTVKFLLGGGRA